MKHFAFSLFLFIVSVSSPAQQDSAHNVELVRLDKYYIHSGLLDARDQVIAPFHWKGYQWATFGGLAVTESALIFAGGDKSLQSFMQSNRNVTTNFIETNFGDPFGSGLYPAIIVGSTYIIGCIFKQDHPKKLAMIAAKSIVISGATTTIIKFLAERHRPYQTNPPNPLLWDGPVGIGTTQYVSFPSGHTTVAFATATSIALIYPHPVIIPVLAYSLATVTAYGRMNGDWHWCSDVLMGAAIGYFTAKLVYNHNNWGKCLSRRIHYHPDIDYM